MEKQFYRIELKDDATASFVTAYKYYYGTLDDFNNFLENLKKNLKKKNLLEYAPELWHAYESLSYESRKSGRISPLQQHGSFFHPVDVLGEKHMVINDYSWKHNNIWDCPYYLRCKNANIRIIYFKDQKNIQKSFKVSFKGLQIMGLDGDYHELAYNYWENPLMLDWNNEIIYNYFFMVETSFQDEEAAKEDLLKENNIPDFSSFCDEIFGNG